MNTKFTFAKHHREMALTILAECIGDGPDILVTYQRMGRQLRVRGTFCRLVDDTLQKVEIEPWNATGFTISNCGEWPVWLDELESIELLGEDE